MHREPSPARASSGSSRSSASRRCSSVLGERALRRVQRGREAPSKAACSWRATACCQASQSASVGMVGGEGRVIAGPGEHCMHLAQALPEDARGAAELMDDVDLLIQRHALGQRDHGLDGPIEHVA